MTRHAIAAGHELTAQAAADTLDAGGNAVDAAIAAALTSMVAEPVLAGLLGGGFLMVREPGGSTRLLDFFVQTPGRKLPEDDLDFRAILAEFGTATQEFHIGAGTIATPGAAPGLAEAHARLGRIPFRALSEPAITAARQGVEVTDFQANLGQIVSAILTATPEARTLCCDDDDKPLPAGATWKNSDFADVLEVYAAEGPRFVTAGEVGQALLALTDQGGHLRAADLKSYSPEWRDPLTIRRGDAQLALNPPPALGGALIAFAMELLGRDPDAANLARAFDATTVARVTAGLDDDPEAGAARLLSADLVSRFRGQLSAPSTRGTTHISVIDKDGLGAALTLSNGEGCGLIAPGTGIMPNNMLGEADLLPKGLDSWATDRRMSSMMCPLALNWPDGRFAMLGSGGSNRIRSALTQVLLGVIDRGLPLGVAIEAPRCHVEAGDPAPVDFEDIGGDAFRDAILSAYPEARPWPERSMFFGGVHGVMAAPGGGLSAAGDPRRAGSARVG